MVFQAICYHDFCMLIGSKINTSLKMAAMMDALVTV